MLTRKTSLRTRILIIVGLTLLPIAALWFYDLYQERDFAKAQIEQRSRDLARYLSIEHSKIVDREFQTLTALSLSPEVRRHDVKACDRLLVDFLRKNSDSHTVAAVANPDGQMWCSSQPDSKVNLFDRPHFQRALRSGKFAFSDFVIGRVSGRASTNFVLPVTDSRGRITSFVITGLGVDWFTNIARESNLPKGTVFLAADANAVVVAHYPDERIGKPIQSAELRRAVLEKPEGILSIREGRGTTVYAFTSIENPGATGRIALIVGIPEAPALDAFLAHVQKNTYQDIVLLVILSLMAAIIGLVYSRFAILEPFERFVAATKKIRNWDLSVRVRAGWGDDELGKLACAINRMADRLVEQNRDLARTGAEIEQRRQEDFGISKVSALTETAVLCAEEIEDPFAALKESVLALQRVLRAPDENVEALRATLSSITAEVTRISRRILSLRRYARDASHDPMEFITVAELLDETLELARRGFRRRGVELIAEPGNGSLKLSVRSIQVEQALLAILNNALEAVADLPERWVHLATRCRNGALEILVTDSGRGISSEIAKNIFDAFYTTKHSRKAMGVGLSVAREVINAHGGEILLSSESTYTQFIIRLPVISAT